MNRMFNENSWTFYLTWNNLQIYQVMILKKLNENEDLTKENQQLNKDCANNEDKLNKLSESNLLLESDVTDLKQQNM